MIQYLKGLKMFLNDLSSWKNAFPWTKVVTKSTIQADILAAITGAIVVLPQAMAFATIAGMPPVYGLYTAMVPAIIAALFGSSSHLVSGPTTTASIRLYSFISMLAVPASEDFISYAITLTFLVGVAEILMGVLRLGIFVNFISRSVIVGFTTGVAFLIIFKQLHNFFGIKSVPNLKFFEIAIDFSNKLNFINYNVLIVGIVTLITGLIFKIWIKNIPYLLASMLSGSIIAFFMNQSLGGELFTGIITMSEVSGGLPPLSVPDFRLDTIQALLPTVFATTLMTVTECVSIAQSISTKSGQRINSNREFIAQGLSNIVGSFFSAFVASGSFNRSSINYESGAKTPLAAVFSAFFLVIILLFVGPLISYLPIASMSAILFLVAYGLLDLNLIKDIFKTSKGEGLVFLITFYMTLFFSMESAILAGVIASFFYYLSNTSRPSVRFRVPNNQDQRRKFIDANDKVCPQLEFIRIDGSIYFGSIGHIEEKLERYYKQTPEAKYSVLIANGINFLDIAGAEFIVAQTLRKRNNGGDFFIYKAKENFLKPLVRNGNVNIIGKDHFFDSKGEIIKQMDNNHLFDMKVCTNCKARIFNECSRFPQKLG